MSHPTLTEKEARVMAVRHYRATHVGWLLTDDAPENKTKGKRLFEALSPGDKTIALQYRDHCLAAHKGG